MKPGQNTTDDIEVKSKIVSEKERLRKIDVVEKGLLYVLFMSFLITASLKSNFFVISDLSSAMQDYSVVVGSSLVSLALIYAGRSYRK